MRSGLSLFGVLVLLVIAGCSDGDGSQQVSLTIQTDSLPSGRVGVSYQVRLQATGGTPPYRWEVAAGQLPQGLSLSSDGLLSGTPQTAGDYQVTIRVSDSAGGTATRTFTIRITAEVAGREYFVSPSGDDSNPGTQERPFRTIGHAAQVVNPGDTVVVLSGTYQEAVQIERSGEEGRPITFVARGDVTLRTPTGGNFIGFRLRQGVSHIRLQGFKLHGFMWGISLDGSNSHIQIEGIEADGEGNGECGLHMTVGEHGNPWYGAVEHVTIRNCYFHHFRYCGIDGTPGPCNYIAISGVRCVDNGVEAGSAADGISIEMGDHIIVEDCESARNQGDGIDIDSRQGRPVSEVVVRRCRSYGNFFNGIKLWWGGRIENCLVYDNGNDALVLENGGNYEVFNCTVAFNRGGYALTAGYEGSVGELYITMRNNIFAFNGEPGNPIGVYFGQRVHLTADYNLYHSRDFSEIVAMFLQGRDFSRDDIARGVWTAASGCDAHAITDDPRFVNPSGRDLHLSANSPAVDRGTSEGAPNDDIDRHPRPQGRGYDLGAYER